MDNADFDEFVSRVRERSDIYSVVSRYVQLNLRGGRYWACCPFHGEKTASFTVTPDKGLFYCFGCHVGGDVFKFISLIENVSYFDAVKLQAERTGVPLPSAKKSREEIESDREKKILFKINDAAKNFYHDCLTKSNLGEVGRKYLHSRGITDSTIEKFHLGFAPDSWDSLSKNLSDSGFSEEKIIAAGLAAKRKSGSGIYDRFRARIIIPVTDIFGHVVAFGGRILKEDAENKSPKYLNTPETLIFNKRKILFGLDGAHGKISSTGFAIIVEGYMDAIALTAAGVENVAATLGTAFTAEHAKLLTRYARRIIFCYDSDEAGQRATVRALPIVTNEGAEVSIIKVPDGKDPDEFIRKHGKEEFDKLIKNSVSPIDYRMKYVLERTDYSTAAGKISALRQIVPVVAPVKNPVLQREYIKKISAVLVTDEDTVAAELRKFSSVQENSSPRKIFSAPVRRQKISRVDTAAENVIRMAWHEGDTLDFVLSLVPAETFSPIHREIIAYFKKCFAEDKRPNDTGAAKNLSEDALSELSKILAEDTGENDKKDIEAFEDSVKILRTAAMKNNYLRKLKEAATKMPAGDPEFFAEMRESMKMKKELDKMLLPDSQNPK